MKQQPARISQGQAIPSHAPGRSGLVQRTCACGGSAGPTGECAECRRNRGLQPRLKINPPGDRYEREADRIADAVMRMQVPDAEPVPYGTLRRRETTNTDLQAKQHPGQTPYVTPNMARNVEALGTRGQHLDASTKAFMEPRLGWDLSTVRIHNDGPAGKLAEQFGARAFTTGRHIVFAPGAFQPHATAGRHLLAHELVHVQQQAAGRSDGPAAVQRQANPQTPQPCDATQTTRITNIQNGNADLWRSRMGSWLRNRAERASDDIKELPNGTLSPDKMQEWFALLTLLDRHFKISDSEWLSVDFPASAAEITVTDLSKLEAGVLPRLADVYDTLPVMGVPFECQQDCSNIAGEAENTGGHSEPGSGKFVVCTAFFDAYFAEKLANAPTCTVLHESLHANGFSGDSYVNTSGYPGATPFTNADSYTNLAAEKLTGSTCDNITVSNLEGVTVPTGTMTKKEQREAKRETRRANREARKDKP